MEPILDFSTPNINTNYAGFWQRFIAAFIDALIVSVSSSLLNYLIFGSAYTFSGDYGFNYYSSGSQPLSIIIAWLYEAVLTSSERQATFGKQAMGLKVCDLNGEKISFGRATGRHFAKIISLFTFLIGYIMAAFTEKKQALHDMIAGTLVVNK